MQDVVRDVRAWVSLVLRFVLGAVSLLSVTPALLGQASPSAQATGAPSTGTVSLTLADALARAKANSPQFQAAVTDLGLAREARLQARAGLLPGVNYANSFIYTQGNRVYSPDGTSSGVFIANNGVHEYISQGIAHEAIGPAEIADYQRATAALALAQARHEVAVRGLVVTVVQSFYGYIAAQNRMITAQQVLDEGQHFLINTQKLEQGGEVAHSDVIKAEIQANDLLRARDEAKLAEQSARLALAVLLFPNFFQDFTLVNDLSAVPPLPAIADVQQSAEKNNPELKAAYAALNVANKEVSVAWAGYLPSLTVDMFYGIDANQFAVYNRDGARNLGYAGAATLNIPVWSWGAIQSKVRQAQLQRNLAKVELSAAQRQAIADLQQLYAEAQTAREHLDLLEKTAALAAESLRLTTLRYQAGEATALEVVDAQNTLATARNNLDDGETRYRVALANLQTLTGPF
jgi:outer membrane protein TolC